MQEIHHNNGKVDMENPLIPSDVDETVMRRNLLKCYGTKKLAFRVSKEHYRYLAEQVVSLRAHLKRIPEQSGNAGDRP